MTQQIIPIRFDINHNNMPLGYEIGDLPYYSVADLITDVGHVYGVEINLLHTHRSPKTGEMKFAATLKNGSNRIFDVADLYDRLRDYHMHREPPTHARALHEQLRARFPNPDVAEEQSPEPKILVEAPAPTPHTHTLHRDAKPLSLCFRHAFDGVQTAITWTHDNDPQGIARKAFNATLMQALLWAQAPVPTVQNPNTTKNPSVEFQTQALKCPPIPYDKLAIRLDLYRASQGDVTWVEDVAQAIKDMYRYTPHLMPKARVHDPDHAFAESMVTASIESIFNRSPGNSLNPTVAGPYHFKDSTYLDMFKKYPELLNLPRFGGVTPNASSRLNAYEATVALMAYRAESHRLFVYEMDRYANKLLEQKLFTKAQLDAAKIEAKDSIVPYQIHVPGPRGATKLALWAQLAPKKTTRIVLGSAFAGDNKSLTYNKKGVPMTVGATLRELARRVGADSRVHTRDKLPRITHVMAKINDGVPMPCRVGLYQAFPYRKKN